MDHESLRTTGLAEGCVRCIEDERGHSERDEEIQVPQWNSRSLCRTI